MEKKRSINFRIINATWIMLLVAFIVIKGSTVVALAAGDGTFDDPYTTKEECITYLRSQRVNRVENIRFYYLPASKQENLMETAEYVSDNSLSHTGISNEGDYLVQNCWSIGYGYDYDGDHHEDGSITNIPLNKNGDMVPILTFDTTYLSTSAEEQSVISTLNTAVADLNLSGSEYDKVKAIYDYVRLNVTYDKSALVIPSGETDAQKMERLRKHSTYAAAVNRKSVCQGYASMLYYMMLQANIKCRIVTGTALADGKTTPESHAWNIVEVDGKWYNVDVTWDSDQGSDKYFLLTSETIATAAYGTHTPNVTFSGYTMATEDNPYKKDDEKNIKASLLGCALTPQDMIDVECYFDSVSWDVSGGTETTGNKVVFDIPSTPGYKQEMTYAEGNPTGSVGGKSCVVFTYRVPARCMSETITAQVVSSDGTKKSEVFRVSVKKYIDVLLEDESKNPGQKEFFKAMLYYGKYAQIYFSMNPPVAADKGYESGNPIPTMTDDIAKGYLKNGKKTDYVNVGKMMYGFYESDERPTSTDSNFKYHASSLVLRSQVVVRHYFELSGNATLDDYTFKSGSKTVQAFEMGGYVCVEIAFSPEEASTMTASQSKSNISVYKSSDPSTAIMSFKYNPMDYAYGVLNNSNYNTNTDLTNLLKAYMWYSVTANIY